MNDSVFNKFLHSIKQINHSGYVIPKKIAIALSGGVDSVALLNLLIKYKNHFDKNIEIHAITIDHGIRKQSHIEAENLNNVILNDLKYPIIHKILKIKEKIKVNQIENHARELRYQLMYKYCNDNNIKTIFMGHHLDDQLETFSLRLLSNSTLFGLMGMKLLSSNNLTNFNKIDLIRPLLNITKDEIYKYANQNSLTWFEDYTNKDIKLTRRNLLRKILSDSKYHAKRLELIDLHSNLCGLLNNAVYSRLSDETSNLIKVNSTFNPNFFSLNIDLTLDKDNLKFLNMIDFMVLDRFLFNKVWLISPNVNYMYGFTKFDNKNSIIENHRNGRSISESFLKFDNKKTQKLTISGCVFEWSTNGHFKGNDKILHVNIKINREREHQMNKLKPVNIPFKDSQDLFYDNRMFLSLSINSNNNSNYKSTDTLQIVNFDRSKFDNSTLDSFFKNLGLFSNDVSSKSHIEKKNFINDIQKSQIPIVTQKNEIIAMPTLGLLRKGLVDGSQNNLQDYIRFTILPKRNLEV